jgi:Tfp pilus assembly protein FimT
MEERGTTLLDLVVAAAVVAVLGAVVAWNAHAWLSDFRLHSAAYQVLADLRLVRARALATATSGRIAFRSGDAWYRKQEKVGKEYVDTAAVPLPRGIAVAGCNALQGAITFTPRGTASTFGTVTLQSEDGKSVRVVVDIAGRVRIAR